MTRPDYCNGAGILTQLATKHAVSVADIKSKTQMRQITRIRDIAVVRLRDELKWSYPRIGQLLNRGHMAIMTAYKREKKRQASKCPPAP